MQIYLKGRCKANVCVVLREFNPTVRLSINKVERVEPLCGTREISVDWILLVLFRLYNQLVFEMMF